MAITGWNGKCPDIFGGKAPPLDPYQKHAASCDCPCHDSWKFGMDEREVAKVRAL